MAQMLPTRLRVLRIARGLSQFQLSVQTEINPNEISQIERGLVPSARKLEVLAQLFGVSPPELLLERISVESDEPSLRTPVQE